MLQLTENLRIRKTDEMNLVIEEYRLIVGRGKNKGKTYYGWANCGYYGSLQAALKGVARKYLFDLTANEQLTITGLIKKIEELEKIIEEKVDDKRICNTYSI